MGRAELNKFTWQAFWGNAFSWKFVCVFFLWAYLSLMIPSKKTQGPVTDFGQVPVYQDNGFSYYWASVTAFLLYNVTVDNGISFKIYDNFPFILGALNTSAFALCALLLIKGRYFPEVKEATVLKRQPMPYEFFAGKELHPQLMGVDVKQLTNCRIGVMS
jgi:7-dehydrocholesterol reductase